MREEGPQVYLSSERSNDEGREEYCRAQREAKALARDRLAIGRVERGELLARKNRYGDRHVVCIFSSRRANKKSRVIRPGSCLLCALQSGRLLAQIVDELNQLDGLIVVFVRDRLPRQVLAVGELFESLLVLLGSVL